MLSSVINSPRAVQVNIEIMRAFVRLRQWLVASADLARRLAALEKKYDGQFKVVFTALRGLMAEPKPLKPAHRREIGFHTLPTLLKSKPKCRTRKVSSRTGHKL